MEKLIQDEAHIYAKWASGHHKAAAQNQATAMWVVGMMSALKGAPRARMMRHRAHLVELVKASIARRDGRPVNSDGVVRVTQ